MFRHVALLTLVPDTTDAEVDEMVTALRGLPSVIPELKQYVVGVDAGVSEGNATIAVVADCEDKAGWEIYRDNPVHQQVLTEMINPRLTARAAVQHQL